MTMFGEALRSSHGSMPFRPPSPGVLLDNKYRLAERIGGGGMGDVFRAENTQAGRFVAIKFLHPELAQNTDLSQRFFQEAQAVNRIRHPNVVEVLDVGVAEMGPYLVMEYLDGESVGSALARVGRFEVDAAVAATIPVLEALEAAHRAGIIHRDLKPENVFIAVDPAKREVVVRLLDFGIAKMTDPGGASPKTRTGVVFGTPDYLSPEQASGEGALDGRSDLFSVGVLLYELLTGLRPFRAPTAVATAFKVVHAEAPSLAATGVQVDARVEAVVQKLLQKEPGKRYPTATEVIRELERASPDPGRRAAALGRVIGAARRLVSTSSEMDRATAASARDVSWSKRSSSDAQGTPTSMASARRISPGVTPPRGLEVPSSQQRSARPSHGEAPRTMMSAVAPAESSGPASRILALRPFPERFAGRFQVRGPVLRSVDRVFAAQFGQNKRDEVVERLSPALAGELRNDSINALVAYDLEALDTYMELASLLVVKDPLRWREMGRLGVDGELHSVVRTLLRPTTDVTSVLRRGISTWARLFSFGAWKVTTTPKGKATLQIGELDAVAVPLRQWLVGVIEQTARRAVRNDLRATITAGDQEFAPELTCELG